MNKIKYIAAVLIGIAGLGLQQAKADTFTLTSDHCTGGCGPQPGGFGTVTLTQVGANVNVTVNLINGNQFVKTGSGGSMYFLFDNAGITLANITNISPALLGGNPLSAFQGPIMADGTGTWQWGIGCALCPNGGAGAFPGPLSFTVTNTTLAAMEVGHLVNGVGIEIFVADILSGTNGNTGPVDAHGGMVPDGGATVMLLGTALGMLGVVRRYLFS
jgi:VPDSG-CTERM motif